MTDSNLNALLDSSPVRKKTGSATVTGAEDTEIYIRPDGKKVRRVKKVVRKQQPADLLGNMLTSSSTPGRTSSSTVIGGGGEESDIFINKDGKKVRRVKRSTSSVGTAGTASTTASGTSMNGGDSAPAATITAKPKTLGGFLDLVGVKKPGIGGSRSVAGDFAKPKPLDSEEFEIYVRPDGKKVRRVKKTIVKSKSGRNLLQDMDNKASNSTTTPASDGLDTFLGSPKSKKTSAATVSGASVSGASHQAGGEVYINAQGKKVRRVVKTPPSKTQSTSGLAAMQQAVSASAPPPGAPPGQEYEVYRRADGKLVRRLKKAGGDTKSSLDTLVSSVPTKKTGAATVGGERVLPPGHEIREEVEIYVRPDGKKVRRTKKVVVKKKDGEETPPTPLPTTKAELSALLDASDSKPAPRTGAATVAAKPTQPEGEIYINADGKKVRRVRRPASSPSEPTKTSSGDLTGMLAQKKPPSVGAATVAGEQPSKDQHEAGEIYIRADGKKVRRVKKTKAAAAVGLVTDKAQLKQMLEQTGGGKIGAATVAGDQVVKQVDDGEIIIRADGKKVLRRKKAPAPDQEGTEVYRRADGKLVRRVKKAPANAADEGASALDQKLGADADNRPRPTSAATVGGDMRGLKPLTNSVKSDSKEEPTRPATPNTAPMSEADSSQAKIECSTVSKDENDTKPTALISQELSPPPDAASKPEIPVPRGAWSLSNTSRTPPQPSWMTKRHSVNEDTPTPEPSAPTERSKEESPPSEPAISIQEQPKEEESPAPEMNEASLPAASESERAPSPSAPASSGLSDDDEAMAGFYRKKLKLGMPVDAVRHKMMQDGVAEHIIVAVCGEGSSSAPTLEAVPASIPVPSPSAPASSGLSDDDEAMAGFYRKKLKLGMPVDAVRHKMMQDGVAEHIIVAVCGEGGSSAPTLEAVPASIPVPSPSAHASSGLSDDDEAMASFYRKKLKMGMPVDAVRHKMMQDGVAEHIIVAVCGDDGSSAPTTIPVSAPSALPSSGQLSDDDEALANFYRKKLKMGMPPDAVRHKMMQDGVAEHIIAAVCDGKTADSVGSPAPAVSTPPTTEGRPFADDTAPSSVAYVVVVSDDPNLKLDKKPSQAGSSLANLPRGGPTRKTASDERSMFSVLPTDKFEVKLAADDAAASGATTKYMTLDELAKMSGQSKTELEDMVVQRRENAQEAPKFVLQPQDLQPGEQLYPVSMLTKDVGGSPTADGSRAVNVPAGVTVPAVKPGEHLASIREDQEVVSASLATAARAIAPLGDDLSALLEKLQMGEMGELMKKLQEAEKRQKKLEKQLAGAGIQIAEDIDYAEALEKVGQIARRMNEIGGSDVVREDKEEQNRLREEYFKLEQEMERYNTALMISEEYQAEQDRKEKEWEASNWPKNLEALRMIRRHMPVNIRSMSEAELTGNPSPNGKFLPQAIAKKFKRTNVLQILRLNPDDIERMHPSTLENMRVTGLTLTERRALYAHLKVLGPRWEKNKAEKMSERKWTWYQMMKNNFKENVAPYDRHVAQYGPPENHPYATRDNPNVGCPLIGKQCPIKADLIMDYRGDYGWTDKDEYEISNVTKSDVDDPGAKAMAEARELAREKKANERADLLKKHYKGKLLQVSKANGSCESMDEAMDKMEFALLRWVEFKIEKGPDIVVADKTKEIANFTETMNEIKLMVLDFCQRSGMQTSGKKKAGGDKPDIRSAVECSLSEEVIEMSKEFFCFIKGRMKELETYDTRIAKTIELLEGMFNELHEKNLAVFVNLQTKRSDRSRKLRTIADITKEVEEKIAGRGKEDADNDEAGGAPTGMPAAGPGRGGLLDAIKGGKAPPGRGGLLDAIKGGKAPPGRGGLLDAIKGGRGRGGGGADGGRGGLMAAIAGRGAGRGGGDGGRGGLMAAIAARGGGG